MARSRKRRRNRRHLGVFWLVAVSVLACYFFSSCRGSGFKVSGKVPKGVRDSSKVLVTGYCNCGKCCGWERSWFGFGPAVYNYGKMKGKPKRVGLTSSGTIARHGTVAADPKIYKYGTRLWIPGYGVGRVEDVGGAIKGRHIDVWFSSHSEALKWGRRWVTVKEIVGDR